MNPSGGVYVATPLTSRMPNCWPRSPRSVTGTPGLPGMDGLIAGCTVWSGNTVPLTMKVTYPVGVAPGVAGVTVAVKVGCWPFAVAVTCVLVGSSVIGNDLDGRWLRSPPNHAKYWWVLVTGTPRTVNT